VTSTGPSSSLVQVAEATGKSREAQTTYISDEAVNLLRELVKGKEPDEYVFSEKEPLTTDPITSATTRILTRAGIRGVNGKVSFHSRREWFTTHLVEVTWKVSSPYSSPLIQRGALRGIYAREGFLKSWRDAGW